MSAKPPLSQEQRAGYRKALLTINQSLAEILLSRQRSFGDGASILDSDPNRKIDKECGYERFPQISHYKELYDRVGVATRVVEVYPDECWSVYPELYERESPGLTGFERVWNDTLEAHNLWYHLDRLDRVSGIGQYGVMMLGLDDGADPSVPVPGVDQRGERSEGFTPRKLLWVREFDESQAVIREVESDPANPRFGQPTVYQIQMANPLAFSGTSTPVNAGGLESTSGIDVHWTRVIHVTDGVTWGVPRMRPVLNDIYDIRKIGGGSAEMFWRGAFPGYSFETLPDLAADADIDDDSIKEQFELYANGLKRYLALSGMTAKPLFPQTADPTPHLTQKILLICIALKVPVRVFTGSEAAHLASTQDIQTWNRRMARRQRLYINPVLIRPLVDRLLLLGVLPAPRSGGYTTDWTDLNTMTDEQKAKVASQKTQALMQYVTSGSETCFPLLHYLIDVFGMAEGRAQMIIDSLADPNRRLYSEEIWKEVEVAGRPVQTGTSSAPGPGGGPPDPSVTTPPRVPGNNKNTQGGATPRKGAGRRRAVTGRNVTTRNEADDAED